MLRNMLVLISLSVLIGWVGSAASWAQNQESDTAQETPQAIFPAQNELSPEQFFQEFVTAFPDESKIQQLVTSNPASAAKVYLWLLRKGAEESDDAGTARHLVSFFKQFPSVKALAQAEQLSQQVIELYQQGKYADAIPLAEEALAIREKVLGPEHPDTATNLNNLAAFYRNMGMYAQAEPLYQRSLAIREQVLGFEHPDTASSLNSLALLYRDMGNYANAELLYQRALAICEMVLGPDHPDTAASFINLAGLYRAMGRYYEAEPLLQRALAICEKTLGPEHPDTAVSLNNLAVLYDVMGKYAEAERLYQQVLTIQEQVLGPEHPGLASSLNNLAMVYVSRGEYARAEPLYQRALTIQEQALGSEHPAVAVSLNNLAGLYEAMGNYTEAESLYQRTLVIQEQALGPEHPDTVSSLNNLAALYAAMGDFTRAAPLYQQTLAIREQALGPEHPDTAASLNNLAMVYRVMGDYAKAEPLYLRALAIDEKVLGPEHPGAAMDLNNLARLYHYMEDYARSEPLFRRALAIRERTLGPEHPYTATSLNNLAGLFAAQGEFVRAHDLFLRAQRIDEQTLEQVLGFTAEVEQRAFLAAIRGSLEGFLSLISQHVAQTPTARRDGLEVWLRRKGVILEAQKRFHEALLLADDPVVLRTFEELSQTRSQLSQLTFAGSGEAGVDTYRKRLNELNVQKDRLEAQLSRLSAAYSASRKVAKADVAQVANALPQESVLIEFAQIDRYNFSAKGRENPWQSAHYLAFVLHAGDAENVQLIDLGEAAPIDEEIEAFKAELAHQDILDFDQVQQLAMRLYRLVFAPLTAALGDAAELFISPDGSLNLIPFEVLINPDDREERFLIERYQFNYLALVAMWSALTRFALREDRHC